MTGNAGELLFAIKTIVDNYLNNRKPAAIVMGTYNGSAVVVNEKLPVPMSMISGNMKDRISPGDKLRLLRNDGGREYLILEIAGKPYQTEGSVDGDAT